MEDFSDPVFEDTQFDNDELIDAFDGVSLNGFGNGTTKTNAYDREIRFSLYEKEDLGWAKTQFMEKNPSNAQAPKKNASVRTHPKKTRKQRPRDVKFSNSNDHPEIDDSGLIKRSSTYAPRRQRRGTKSLEFVTTGKKKMPHDAYSVPSLSNGRLHRKAELLKRINGKNGDTESREISHVSSHSANDVGEKMDTPSRGRKYASSTKPTSTHPRNRVKHREAIGPRRSSMGHLSTSTDQSIKVNRREACALRRSSMGNLPTSTDHNDEEECFSAFASRASRFPSIKGRYPFEKSLLAPNSPCDSMSEWDSTSKSQSVVSSESESDSESGLQDRKQKQQAKYSLIGRVPPSQPKSNTYLPASLSNCSVVDRIRSREKRRETHRACRDRSRSADRSVDKANERAAARRKKRMDEQEMNNEKSPTIVCDEDKGITTSVTIRSKGIEVQG